MHRSMVCTYTTLLEFFSLTLCEGIAPPGLGLAFVLMVFLTITVLTGDAVVVEAMSSPS